MEHIQNGMTASPNGGNFPPVIERAIKYDGRITEYACRLLSMQNKEFVLLHHVEQGFHIPLKTKQLTIAAGTFTFAYYWLDRPYNAYYWIAPNGEYVGTYLNLVKQTRYCPPVLSFYDLMIDVVSLPDGTVEVLDEEELPVPISQFENGSVQAHLAELREALDGIIGYMAEQTSILRKAEHCGKREAVVSLTASSAFI